MQLVESTSLSRAAVHIQRIKEALERKWTSIQNASYETGLLGLALFYSYYADFSGEQGYKEKAEEFFQKGVASLNPMDFKRIYATDSLDGHLAHVGRFIGFCNTNGLLQLDANGFLEDIDNSLSQLMTSKIAMGNFDPNCGALAAGYYFLSRPRDLASINGHLGTIVSGITATAFKDRDGDNYWEVPFLGKRVFLGISHGSALIIAFLANVYERGIEEDTCKSTLYKAIRFLLKQRANYNKGLFPHYIGDPENDRKQFSLCYGDLGIGYALYRAASVLRDVDLLAYANEVLDDCLSYTKEDKLTIDASIIYGASGLAATFDKLHRITRDPRFLQAADYWYAQIPSYAVHQNTFAGYQSRLLTNGGLWQINFGWGIIGIGISLMRSLDRELPPIDPLLIIA